LLCGTEVATGKTGAEKYGVIAGDVIALCGIKGFVPAQAEPSVALHKQSRKASLYCQ